MITFASAILAFVTVQRLGELVIAKRNTARLLEKAPEKKPPDTIRSLFLCMPPGCSVCGGWPGMRL